MITFAIALKRATSAPSWICRCPSAISASGIFLGSTTYNLAPLRTAFLTRTAMMGWHSVMLVPTQSIIGQSSISGIEFDIAPRPIEAARPATVGLCQAREQLST